MMLKFTSQLAPILAFLVATVCHGQVSFDMPRSGSSLIRSFIATESPSWDAGDSYAQSGNPRPAAVASPQRSGFWAKLRRTPVSDPQQQLEQLRNAQYFVPDQYKTRYNPLFKKTAEELLRQQYPDQNAKHIRQQRRTLYNQPAEWPPEARQIPLS